MKCTSIRARLISRLTLVLLAVAVSANAGLFVYLRGELIEQYDDALTSQAEAVAAVWRTVGDQPEAGTIITQAFPKLRFGRRGGDFLWVRRKDGAIVLNVPAPLAGEWNSEPPAEQTSKYRVYNLTLPNGTPGRAARIDTASTNAADRFTHYELILAESRREMDGTLTNFAIWLSVIGGGLSAAAIVMALVVVTRELSPLHEFSEAVGGLDDRSLAYRFPTAGLADELLPVSRRLNDLLGRLEAAFSRERRFTGNVAHELRTPLAELRSMVEVAMKWPPDPAELSRHHQQVLQVVKRMSAVTQSLLNLVRSDSGQLSAARTSIDLIPLLKSAARSHEQIARDRGIEIDLENPVMVDVLADPVILSSLLDNLFSNAAIHAAPNSRIHCQVLSEESKRAVIVRLTNTAHDLIAGDLSHLAEPFWRKDAARSASDHAGLGLSLVRTYATATGTEVTFRLEGDAQFVVEVIIPQQLVDEQPSPPSDRAPVR